MLGEVQPDAFVFLIHAQPDQLASTSFKMMKCGDGGETPW